MSVTWCRCDRGRCPDCGQGLTAHYPHLPGDDDMPVTYRLDMLLDGPDCLCEVIQALPARHQDWTAEQWLWRWLDVYGEPTTLDEALGSHWAGLVGEAEVRAAHARLLPLGVTR